MKRIGIVGAGRFGASLAHSLAELGVEVLVLDRRRDVVDRMAGVAAKAMEGDAAEEGTLDAAGFRDCDIAVVAVGSDMDCSVLATLMLKEMKIPCVIAKAADDIQGKVLQKVGADRIVFPDRDMAARLARSLVSPSVLEYVEVAEGISVLEIAAPMVFVGKTLGELKIRKNYGVTVLVLRRAERSEGKQETIVSPDADDTVELGDTIVIFGLDEKLRHMEQELA
ncbi:MAG: TrkA family potassium uptake protein [Kiritimatiellae bacterium]|nr:TrkA family potassium uptake protein [Kiritimatiellia bacterium]